jgi:hypothetical protein
MQLTSLLFHMIIMPMAITRCPYCHAIIDEHDKYCNNCGTQLLFSEDDEIEEEIPGEKIVDAEIEEKDYTIEEPEDDNRPASDKDLDSEIDEDLAEGTRVTPLDELVAGGDQDEDDHTEEVVLIDEVEAAGKDGAATSEPAPKPEPAGAAEVDDEEEEIEEDLDLMEDDGLPAAEELADEPEEEGEARAGEAVEEPAGGTEERPRREVVQTRRDETTEFAAAGEEADAPAAAPDEPEVEYVTGPGALDESAIAGEASHRAATFDTKDLEELGRTVELGKDKVDQILEAMSEKQPPTLPSPPPGMPTPEMPTPEMSAPDGMGMTPTGSLPPWASTMKGAPVFAEETGAVETRKFRGGEPRAPETEEEVEIFPKRRAADSTIGLPEKVGQSPLPFDEPSAEEAEETEEEAGEEAEEPEEEEIEERHVRGLTDDHIIPPGGDARPMPRPDSIAAAGDEEESAEGAEEPARPRQFSFPVFAKAKAFDVLFVGLFWLVAIWLAARSMDMTLFAILGVMSGSMILLYAVFLLIYYFLFKFFLGETLGDRLFRPRE